MKLKYIIGIMNRLLVLIILCLCPVFTYSQNYSSEQILIFQNQVLEFLNYENVNSIKAENDVSVTNTASEKKPVFKNIWFNDLNNDSAEDLVFEVVQKSMPGLHNSFIIGLVKDDTLTHIMELYESSYDHKLKVDSVTHGKIFTSYYTSYKSVPQIFVVHNNWLIEESYRNCKAHNFIRHTVFLNHLSRKIEFNNFFEYELSETTKTDNYEINARINGGNELFIRYTVKNNSGTEMKTELMTVLKLLNNITAAPHSDYWKEIRKIIIREPEETIKEISFTNPLHFNLKNEFSVKIYPSGYKGEFLNFEIGDYDKIPENISGFHWYRLNR